MKLIMKQKIVSWFDSYNVYDENDNVVFIVKGKFAWGHKFVIYDSNGNELGCIKEKILSWLSTFEIYRDNKKIGQIKRELTLFKPKYIFELGNYEIVGNIWELKYQIKKNGVVVASVNKKLLSWTDTYSIETNAEDAFNVLLITLAIDADKCVNATFD